MPTKELLDYIKYQLDHGESWESTKKDLANSGWATSILDEAYNELAPKDNTPAVSNIPAPMVEVPNAKTEIAPKTDPIKIEATPAQELISNTPQNPISIEPKKATQSIASGITVPGLPNKTPTNQKKGGLVFLVVIVVFLLLFLAGGTYAYFTYFNSESVISKVFQSSQKINSADFGGNLEIEVPIANTALSALGDTANKATGKIDIQGKYDFIDATNIKLDLVLKLNAKNENNENYGLNSEIKVIDNNIYGKINDIIAPSVYEQSTELSLIKKIATDQKWVNSGLTNQGPEENISFTLNKERNNIIANNTELTKKLVKALDLSFVGIENYNNSLCTKYNVKFNTEKTKDLLREYSKENGATEDEINANIENINKIADSLSKIKIETLIGTSDFLIHKLTFSFSDQIEAGTISIKGSLFSKNENKPMDIQAPNESVLLDDIIHNALQGDQELYTFFDQIKGTTNNFKSIKGTYVGFEKADGENPIIAAINNLGGKPVDIYTSKDKYCVNKEMISTVEKSICTDTTNEVKEGICDKEKIECIFAQSQTEEPKTEEQDKKEETPVSNKPEIETLIDSLAASLQKHNTEKSTYLGYISSKEGITAVNKINSFEGKALVVATSKVKFCIMKENAENTYCVDSTGYSGASNKCSTKNISCE